MYAAGGRPDKGGLLLLAAKDKLDLRSLTVGRVEIFLPGEILESCTSDLDDDRSDRAVVSALTG